MIVGQSVGSAGGDDIRLCGKRIRNAVMRLQLVTSRL